VEKDRQSQTILLFFDGVKNVVRDASRKRKDPPGKNRKPDGPE
jgi:hypothetical protein